MTHAYHSKHRSMQEHNMREFSNHHLTRIIGLTAACAALLPAPALLARPVADSPETPSSPAYLRVVEQRGKSIALEIATTEFIRADGTGPRVALVGVAHIADQSFFDGVAKLLDSYDVVL
jgi:hypothetical protein